MAVASVKSGTPLGLVWRSRARRSSRKVMRATIATATDPNRSVSVPVMLSATVPVPAVSRRAAALVSSRAIRSSTSSARKASKSAKCRCRTPLAQPASVVTARLVSAFGPSRSRMRSAAANSCSRTSRRATPVGTVPAPLARLDHCSIGRWAHAHYGGHMPTRPPKQSPPVDNEPHRARQVAESFGVDAERYDRARPRYPDALVQRIVEASPGGEVLDVGCGTGIAARQFQALGCTVLGVDPDPRMAEFARQSGVDAEYRTA